MSTYQKQIPPAKGTKLYAKEGVKLNFYELTTLDKLIMVPPQGGSKGQDNPPSRTSGAFVGTAVGRTTYLENTEMVLLDWTNRWWRDGTIFPPQKGKWLEDNRTGYVKLSEITYEGLSYYENVLIVEPEDKTKVDDRNTDSGNDNETPGTTDTKFNWWWVIIAILIIRKL